MKNSRSIFAFVVLSALLITSCNTSECTQKNEILANNEVSSAAYKAELANILLSTDKSKLTYYLESYHEVGDAKYMMVNIESEDLCGVMKVEFEDFQKGAEQIIEKKGNSYNGAQLQNLQFAINSDGVDTKFVFISVTSVND